MNNDKQETKPTLENLVARYQETQAPLGFAERVQAEYENRYRRPALSSPVFAYAASFGVAVLIAALAINFQSKERDESEKQAATQIAKLDNNQDDGATINHSRQQEPQNNTESVTMTNAIKSSATPDSTKTIKKSVTVKIIITELEKEQFLEVDSNTDTATLASLSDISSWITDQKEISVPDIGDLPDLSELDSLFDAT